MEIGVIQLKFLMDEGEKAGMARSCKELRKMMNNGQADIEETDINADNNAGGPGFDVRPEQR